MPENEHEYDRPMNADEQARAARLTETELQTIDECILSNISHHWRKTAKVVALTMGEIAANLRLPDVFYSGRIKHLAEAGLIEAVGNLNRMRFSEVRLPSQREGSDSRSAFNTARIGELGDRGDPKPNTIRMISRYVCGNASKKRLQARYRSAHGGATRAARFSQAGERNRG